MKNPLSVKEEKELVFKKTKDKLKNKSCCGLLIKSFQILLMGFF